VIDRLLLENALAIYDHNGAIVKDDIIGAARAHLQLLQSVSPDDVMAALDDCATLPHAEFARKYAKLIRTLLQAVAGVQK
jgi:hypothetical protein